MVIFEQTGIKRACFRWLRQSFRLCAVTMLMVVVGAYVAAPSHAADDTDLITGLMVDSYVKGVYVDRDETAVLKGFHPDFVLHVKRDEQIVLESLSQWLARLDLDGTPGTQLVDHKVGFIDVAGDTATARLEIYLDGEHVFTDYFGFYRFEEGWRFINKIFYDNR